MALLTTKAGTEQGLLAGMEQRDDVHEGSPLPCCISQSYLLYSYFYFMLTVLWYQLMNNLMNFNQLMLCAGPFSGKLSLKQQSLPEVVLQWNGGCWLLVTDLKLIFWKQWKISYTTLQIIMQGIRTTTTTSYLYPDLLGLLEPLLGFDFKVVSSLD